MVRTTERATTRSNIEVRDLSPAEVEAHLLARDATLVDVREAEEVAERGWIAGAVHVPGAVLDERAGSSSHEASLDPRRLIIVHDAAGTRSIEASETLVRLGYRDVARLAGGIDAWERAGYPVAGRARWHRGASSR